MECAPVRAQAWLDAHDLDFGDLRIETVVAMVERAGLRARVLPYAAGRADEEQRGDQVNLWLTRSGELGAVDAG